MDREFIQEIETWGSGGQMMDILTLKNGRILVITESDIALYEGRGAFDSGAKADRIDLASTRSESQQLTVLRPARSNRA